MPVTTLTAARTDDMTLDIGLAERASTDVTLAAFSAVREQGGAVRVRWETVDERDNAFFRVIRLAPAAEGGEPRQVVVAEVPSKGSAGAQYELRDKEAPAGNVIYWLVAVETNGSEDRYGPADVAPTLTKGSGVSLYLPLLRR
jgi:hypothetical protein